MTCLGFSGSCLTGLGCREMDGCSQREVQDFRRGVAVAQECGDEVAHSAGVRAFQADAAGDAFR